MIIYKTTNLINGKLYIGQTIREDENYFGSGIYLKKSIQKYGKENFIRETLCECKTQSDLDKMEKFWIKELDSTNQNIGYNIHIGGTHYYSNSGTTNEKISKSHLGMKYPKCFGEKISKKLMGRKLSNEQKQKLTVAQKKRWRELSEEQRNSHRESCSKSAKKRFKSNEERMKISKALSGKKKSKDHIEKMRRTNTIVFTKYELDKIFKLRLDGLSYEKIAKELGVSTMKIWNTINNIRRV